MTEHILSESRKKSLRNWRAKAESFKQKWANEPAVRVRFDQLSQLSFSEVEKLEEYLDEWKPLSEEFHEILSEKGNGQHGHAV